MKSRRALSIVGCHAEGEVGDVIIGGVLDIPTNNMHDKLLKFMDKYDSLRKLLHNEPRGRPEMSTIIITPACDPRADAGFLIMAPGEWVPMSGSNAICTTTVLLETGIVAIEEPTTRLNLESAAGMITVTAECDDGSCKSVSFNNVPAFAYALDMEIELPGYGKMLVDIAYGGQWYVVIKAEDLEVKVSPECSTELLEVGRLAKKAVLEVCMPAHPENSAIKGINSTLITEPLGRDKDGCLSVKHTVVVPPGRLDRSPCGTGSSCRLAIMHERGEVEPDQEVRFRSIIDTMFVGKIKSTSKVGQYDAVVPNIKGRAWITGEKRVYLDPDDPFPEGYQLK